MPSFCRFVGGLLLVFATAGYLFQAFEWTVPGAALAFVWLVAGQLAEVIEREQRQRDRPPHL